MKISASSQNQKFQTTVETLIKHEKFARRFEAINNQFLI
jgi:hypothetical protein